MLKMCIRDRLYISAALLTAQVMAVDVNEEEKFAQVIVPDDQLWYCQCGFHRAAGNLVG